MHIAASPSSPHVSDRAKVRVHSGAIAGISAGSPNMGSENNSQATRTESAQTVLIKTAQATLENDSEPAFGGCGGVATKIAAYVACWQL
jgi:hypothetical protein